MNIEDMTYKQIKEVVEMFSGQTKKARLPFKVGDKLLIRTCTHYHIGKVDEIMGNFIKLVEASWVQDTGRFYDALKNGISDLRESEIEPFPECAWVNIESIVDAAPWMHDLPKIQK